MTIVGTRPEIIRLSRTIDLLDNNLDHILVHTGQNYDYELNQIFFDDLEIRQPDQYLNVAGKSLAATIGNIISESDLAMEEHQPDAILILGDTNSCLAAIPAKRRKIPIFHMEAGNRCFDFCVPEEINRRIVDTISDINLPYTQIARDYLIQEGFPVQQIIRTGSPMKEVIDYYSKKSNDSGILKDLKLKQNQYILVSIHREENVDDSKAFNEILKSLENIQSIYSCKIIVSTHPRTKKRLENINLNESISFQKPFSFSNYLKLLKNAKCVLSDSGTITEESSLLNFPAVSIRHTNERPEGFEEGSVIMSGINSEDILDSVNIVINRSKDQKRLTKIPNDYLVDNFSEKILIALQSYIPFINDKVWRKTK